MVSRPETVSSFATSQPTVSFSSFSEKISILPEGVSSALATGSAMNFSMEIFFLPLVTTTPFSWASSKVGSAAFFARACSYRSRIHCSSVLPSSNLSFVPILSAISCAISNAVLRSNFGVVHGVPVII